MVYISNKSNNGLKDIIFGEYCSHKEKSDIIITDNNRFQYNYVYQIIYCISNTGLILAQKLLSLDKWLFDPYNEITLWESELISWE